MVTPDGATVVASAANGDLRRWSVGQHRVDTLSGHAGCIVALTAGPDGTLLAAADEQRNLTVWRIAGRTPVTTAKTDERGGALCLAFTADGRSGDRYSTVHVWAVTPHS